MKWKYTLLISSVVTVLESCTSQSSTVYPATERENTTDNYFGTAVADPYRWLENDTSAATAAWVEAQNKVTDAYLKKIPFRDRLKQRLTDLTNYERIGIPSKRNGNYYYFRNDGLQNQSVLYGVKETLDGDPTVVLDPNRLSDDGTVALSDISFSHDGKYMAYTISRSGSDWREIFVLDLTTGKETGDHIQWAKFTDVSWKGDGFYYSAYPMPAEGKELSEVNQNHRIYFHRLGQPQLQDVLVYENPDQPKRFYSSGTSSDEHLLFVSESGAESGNNLYLQDISKANTRLIQLTTNMEYEYYPIEATGDKMYIYTNYKAPRYRVMMASLAHPQVEHWTEIIPERESVLAAADMIGGRLVLTYMQDASHRAYVYTVEGKQVHEIELPTLGSVSFSGQKDDPETFYLFTSFTFPPSIYRYDMDTNESELYLAPKVSFDPNAYVTKQVFYPSKDGTRIPMFITHRKDLSLNGKNPLLLYGYGGFNISLNPSFAVNRLAFLEQGGIYAQANLRGGGEYGEEWHQAGTKMNKQNVFDDFIAAATYLVQQQYTCPEKLAINGGSNGGLLVGAVVNQRPELFRVALPAVGVMDMLRYHRFTIGWNWASDYGTSQESPEMFRYLYAYSPLHTIKDDGTPYPAILVTTADHDDRVVPAHSFKYAATLQAANTGSQPKLIRIESKAGHGAGKPIAKILEEQADVYAFMMYHLGMKPKY